MRENKLSMACNKFDEFKMFSEESVEAMMIRFTKILEVVAIYKNKFKQQEKNLKVMLMGNATRKYPNSQM